MQSHPISKLTNSDTFIISSLSVFSAALSFIFEAGFASYYNIPYSVIYIDINKILISLSLTATFIYMLWQIAFYLKSMFSHKGKLISATCIALIPSAFLASIFFLLERYIYLWGCLAIFLGTTAYSYWLLCNEELLEKEAAGRKLESPLTTLSRDIFAFSFLIAITAYALGYRQAADKTSYFVTDSKDALIEIYGDKAITVGFNEQTNTLNGRIKITQIDSNGISGETRELGKLLKRDLDEE